MNRTHYLFGVILAALTFWLSFILGLAVFVPKAFGAAASPCYLNGSVLRCFGTQMAVNGSTAGATFTVKAAGSDVIGGANIDGAAASVSPRLSWTMDNNAAATQHWTAWMNRSDGSFRLSGGTTNTNDGTDYLTLSSAGLATFATGIKLPTSGGTATTLDYYEEWTGTVTLSGGFAANPTGTAYIVRIGTFVYMDFGSASLTASANSSTSNVNFTFSNSGSNIPTRFAPTTSQFCAGCVTVYDNSTVVTGGSYSVSSSAITISKATNGASNSFTSTNNKGYYGGIFTWRIR